MLSDFLGLIFPSVCQTCHNPLLAKEELICTVCRYDFPRSNYHLHPQRVDEAIHYGIPNFGLLLPYLKFVKGGKVQTLLHKLKYGNLPAISSLMGEWFGYDLIEAGFRGRFDMVIPVPLHPSKQKRRGYNQVEGFAQNLAGQLEAEARTDILQRVTATETQTKKSRINRFFNVDEVFHVKPALGEALNEKRILLVDDVITTGATLVSTATVLNAYQPKEISFGAIAIARH